MSLPRLAPEALTRVRLVLGRALEPLRAPAIVDAGVRTARFLRRGAGGSTEAGPLHIIVAPPGGGNIGDQAMMEAFIEAVGGRVIAVVAHRENLRRLDRYVNVRALELPHLVYGDAPRALRDTMKLLDSWRGASSLSVVGADVMDGAYNWKASVARANIARWAAESGLDSRVLGFSWNTSPHPRAESALRRASIAGVRLLARDPLSEERLVSSGMLHVISSADIVFTSRTSEAPSPGWGEFTGGRPLAIVNASALVGRSFDQALAYVEVVCLLVDQGYAVLLTPHVIRSGDDDTAECRAVKAMLSPDVGRWVSVLAEESSPGQIRALVSHSELVITGRMHLSIIALSVGVPTVVVATQGKVDGLMSMFDMQDLVVKPSVLSTGALAVAVTRLLGSISEYRSRVESRLPTITDLAWRNVVGLHSRA